MQPVGIHLALTYVAFMWVVSHIFGVEKFKIRLYIDQSPELSYLKFKL